MNETTVYLTDDLKQQLERVAAERGQSEAEMILAGIRMILAFQGPKDPPLPSFGIFATDDPDLASKTDELLKDFGKQ
jgi:hypothetical protein